MNRLKFWKRAKSEEVVSDSPVIKRFNIEPRTDTGTVGLPTDPAQAARMLRLRKQRETVLLEVTSAEAAASEQNRWQTEIGLMNQALEEIDADIAGLDQPPGPAGAALPETPISGLAVSADPAMAIAFTIGGEAFSFAEEIDWAERGNQIARSELHRESGRVDSLIPAGLSSSECAALATHLEASLFVFATDVRDRFLESAPLPVATLSQLALPSESFGGWLDWSGQSPIAKVTQSERSRLQAERARLEGERDQLTAERARLIEQLPFAHRRLAEIDREIAAISQGT